MVFWRTAPATGARPYEASMRRPPATRRAIARGRPLAFLGVDYSAELTVLGSAYTPGVGVPLL